MTAADLAIRPGDQAGAAALLEVSDVSVYYGALKAVEGITMQLSQGRIFGLMGPNGSGKSTLIGAITRLVDVTFGTLTLDGTRYDRMRPAAIAQMGVARTFQTVRLLPGLTVLDNVMLGADLHARPMRSPKGLVAQRARAAIERTGLEDYTRSRPGELSYGAQRRVEIARAIATDPKLLLLDEPTAGMNRGERLEISGLLKRLRSEGLTQLIVEHDVSMMVATCDYLFTMSSGVLIAQGVPADVVREEVVRKAYLGERWRNA